MFSVGRSLMSMLPSTISLWRKALSNLPHCLVVGFDDDALGRLWVSCVVFGQWRAVPFSSVLSCSFYIWRRLQITCLKTCPISFLCQIFQLGMSPAKFELGCQVFRSQYVFHMFLPQHLPSLNLAAKFAQAGPRVCSR
jgi:hypothetical protein